MTRGTQHVVLLAVGVALVKIVVDGTFVRYVRPAAAAAVLVAGATIVLLALVAIQHDVRAPAPAAEHGHRTRSAWLLTLPVLAILLVAPPALSSAAATRLTTSTNATRGPVSTVAPLPPGEAPALDLVDFVTRSVDDPSGPLTGRDITLVGMVVPPAARDGPGRDLVRLVISCCAADAAPVRVHLLDPARIAEGTPVPAESDGAGSRGDPPTAAGDRWVRVRGRYVAGSGAAADHVPTLRVVVVEPTTAPEPAYEY